MAGQLGQFVYYKRLETDAKYNPSLAGLYSRANSMVRLASGFSVIKRNSIIASLKSQAQGELSKELEALRRAWGVEFSADDIQGPYFYDNLIRAINTQIQTNAVYQRNKDRLAYESKTGKKNALAKIDITKFLGTYFPAQWKANSERIVKNIVARANSGMEPVDAVQLVLNQELPGLLNEALIAMFQSKAFDESWNAAQAREGNKRWEEDTAYREIVEQLQLFGNETANNPILKRVWDMYNFDGMIANLTEEISKSLMGTMDAKAMAKAIGTKIKRVSGNASTSGTLAEYIWSLIASNVNKGNNISVKMTGGSEYNLQKADYMIAYNADLSGYLDEFQSGLSDYSEEWDSKRVQNILASNRATEFLENNSVGFNFIAYVNAKNYSLEGNFERNSGFSAGAPIALTHLGSILSKDMRVSPSNVDDLITTLIQFGDGAVGAGSGLEQNILNNFSELMANFLFDDYANFCYELDPGGSNAIHLFALNGIYVPLSFFLSISADALKIGWEESEDYFKFSLNTVPILYGDLPYEEFGNPDKDYWGTQRDDALARTTLSFHFLKSFQTLIGSLV